jgi:hypothetical protein
MHEEQKERTREAEEIEIFPSISRKLERISGKRKQWKGSIVISSVDVSMRKRKS